MERGPLEWIKGAVRSVRQRLGGWAPTRTPPESGQDTAVGATTTEGDSPEEGDQFIPSRLDASVLEAHGMATTEAERELESIEEKAKMLEDEYPDEEHRR